MLIGHYSVAFIVKALNTDLPLWLLLLSTQISDLMCFTLIRLGVETMEIHKEPKNLMFFHGDIYWTHSAVVGIPLAAFAVILLYKVFCPRETLTLRKAVWFTLTCASHFCLDIMVHAKHLPWITPKLLSLLGQDPNRFPRIGYGLWITIPDQGFHQLLEASLTILALLFLVVKNRGCIQWSVGSWINIILLALVSGGIPLHIYLDSLAPGGVQYPTVHELLVVMIILNGIYASLGRWMDSNIITVSSNLEKKSKQQ